MRRMLCVGVVFVVSLGLSGCGGNTPDAVMEKSIATMETLADALEKGDKDGARAAANALKDLEAKGKAFNLTAEQKTALEEKYKDKLGAAMGRLFKAMFGAMASGKFTPADLDEIGGAMKK